MQPEDAGHALLTSWAEWVVSQGHRCCLWYPITRFERVYQAITRTAPPAPASGLMPIRVKAVQRGINTLPKTTQAVIAAKYLLPGDDDLKWLDLSISRRTWYRQIAEARRAIGIAAEKSGLLTFGTK